MSAYRTVVVGTDGSDSSLRAVEKAGSIAGANAKLIVATAYLPQNEACCCFNSLRSICILGDKLHWDRSLLA